MSSTSTALCFGKDAALLDGEVLVHDGVHVFRDAVAHGFAVLLRHRGGVAVQRRDLGGLLERGMAGLGEVLVHRHGHEDEQDAEEHAERAAHVGEGAIPLRRACDHPADHRTQPDHDQARAQHEPADEQRQGDPEARLVEPVHPRPLLVRVAEGRRHARSRVQPRDSGLAPHPRAPISPGRSAIRQKWSDANRCRAGSTSSIITGSTPRWAARTTPTNCVSSTPSSGVPVWHASDREPKVPVRLGGGAYRRIMADPSQYPVSRRGVLRLGAAGTMAAVGGFALWGCTPEQGGMPSEAARAPTPSPPPRLYTGAVGTLLCPTCSRVRTAGWALNSRPH